MDHADDQIHSPYILCCPVSHTHEMTK